MYLELMLLDAYKFCFPLLKTNLYSLWWFSWVQGINSQSGYLFSRCLQTHTHLKWLYLLSKLNILSLVMLFDSKVYSFWYYYWYISFLFFFFFSFFFNWVFFWLAMYGISFIYLQSFCLTSDYFIYVSCNSKYVYLNLTSESLLTTAFSPIDITIIIHIFEYIKSTVLSVPSDLYFFTSPFFFLD